MVGYTVWWRNGGRNTSLSELQQHKHSSEELPKPGNALWIHLLHTKKADGCEQLQRHLYVAGHIQGVDGVAAKGNTRAVGR